MRIIKRSPAHTHRVVFETPTRQLLGKQLENCNMLCCSPEFGLGSLQLLLKRQPASSQVRKWLIFLFYRLPELGCCMSITGCVFYQLSHHLYLAAQLMSSKTTLVPSVSANGCFGCCISYAISKAELSNRPFFDARWSESRMKSEENVFPLRINMPLTFLPSILGEVSYLTSLAVLPFHSPVFSFSPPLSSPIFTTAWLEFKSSSRVLPPSKQILLDCVPKQSPYCFGAKKTSSYSVWVRIQRFEYCSVMMSNMILDNWFHLSE